MDAQYVHWFCMGMLVITGIVKIVAPKAMANDFYHVPRFAWRFVGAWEIYAAYLCHNLKEWTEGLSMVYMFFGGVVACCSTSDKFMIIPFPLLNVVANCVNGLNNGVDTTAHIVPYLTAGYLFTLVLNTVFGGSKPASKKKAN